MVMPLDAQSLRRVIGHFPTGVGVVTTRSETGSIHGLTANAVTSVSLVPPLLLICIDKKARSLLHLERSGIFTVNILAAGQEELSRRFATSGGEKFEGVSYRVGDNGAPLLEGAVGYLECSVWARHEAGDHVIFLGQVERAEARRSDPLVFFRGRYRMLD
jgi:flavin reductase (DIM6/NTAB) family NADH-FMN oxidoreductase RutF